MTRSITPKMTVTQTGGGQTVLITPPGATTSQTPPMATVIQNETQTVEMFPN